MKTHPLWEVWNCGGHSPSKYREALGDVLVQWEELQAEHVRLSSQKEELPCTCGSGGHPRRCLKHPQAFELHVLELDYETAQHQIAELQRDKESLTQQLATARKTFWVESDPADKLRIEALEQALAVKIQDLTATQQRFEAETQLTDRLTRELSSRAATSQALAYRANTADERISELYQCIGELREALAASATLVCDGNCPAAVMEGPHSDLCQQIAKLLAIPQAVEPQP